jgi:hypothetical protein
MAFSEIDASTRRDNCFILVTADDGSGVLGARKGKAVKRGVGASTADGKGEGEAVKFTIASDRLIFPSAVI